MARLHYKDPDTGQWVAIATEGPPGSDANVGAHEAAPDPHPQYLTPTEHSALDHTGIPGVGGGGVTDHGALTGLSDADHPIAAVQGLQTALDGKSPTGHTHAYAPTSHTHVEGDLPTTLATDAEVTAAVSAHNSGSPHVALASTTPPALTPDIAAAQGVGTTAARADHVHNVPAAAPAASLNLNSTNAEGTGTSFARNDHSHSIQTISNAPNAVSGATGGPGTSQYASRHDHVHRVDTGTPVALGSAIAAGTSDQIARADHVHPNPLPTGGSLGQALVKDSGVIDYVVAWADMPQPSSSSPSDISLSAAAIGAGFEYARATHVHKANAGTPVALGSAAAQGSAATIARSDHVHPYPTAANVGAEASGAVASHAAAVDPHTGYVKKAGDTMSGNLTVAGTVTADIVSTNNLNDVAGIVMSPEPSAIAFWNSDVSGLAPLMAGSLTLMDPVTDDTQAATKAYVDSKAGGGGGSALRVAVFETVPGAHSITIYTCNHNWNLPSDQRYRILSEVWYGDVELEKMDKSAYTLISKDANNVTWQNGSTAASTKRFILVLTLLPGAEKIVTGMGAGGPP